MDIPATVEDIAVRWRPLQDNETTVAETRLDDAWRKLRRLVPSIESRMSDQDVAADVVATLADAVIRLLRNPEGIRRRTITVDDGTSTADYGDTGVVSAGLYFTDAEIDALTGTTARRRARAFSVQPS